MSKKKGFAHFHTPNLDNSCTATQLRRTAPRNHGMSVIKDASILRKRGTHSGHHSPLHFCSRPHSHLLVLWLTICHTSFHGAYFLTSGVWVHPTTDLNSGLQYDSLCSSSPRLQAQMQTSEEDSKRISNRMSVLHAPNQASEQYEESRHANWGSACSVGALPPKTPECSPSRMVPISDGHATSLWQTMLCQM